MRACLVHGALRPARGEVLRVASPFDYPAQAALYVPRQLPRPNDRATAPPSPRSRSGGAPHRRPHHGAHHDAAGAARDRRAAAARFEALGELEVLVQGQWPKRRLIERFREGAAGRPSRLRAGRLRLVLGRRGRAGDALQLVIIDKLPVPAAGDPLVEARSQRLEARGAAPSTILRAEAAVALKQGAGRLIRRETDQGVLVVCDPRLVQMGYWPAAAGRRLPPMRRVDGEAAFEDALAALSPGRGARKGR
jgi:ATP-dependent DNA helicase DinG